MCISHSYSYSYSFNLTKTLKESEISELNKYREKWSIIYVLIEIW
jgi:hypothetical protein